MERKVHLVMPMGGAGTRFFDNGFDCPKPLISLWERPFFYWATQSVRRFIPLQSLTFVVLREHVERFEIDRAIRMYYPEAKIVTLEKVLPGAVLTGMEGAKTLPEDDTPVIFNDCDHCFLASRFSDFLQSGEPLPDGALLTFASHDPKFSFAQFGENGNVTRTVEKQAISGDAICGAYFFRNRARFLSSAEEYLTACDYAEFFMSGVYNGMAAHGMTVRAFRVDTHIPFGTPEEYRAAQAEDRSEAWME